MTKKESELAGKIKRYLRAREFGKRNYQRADRLMEEIVAAEPKDAIALNESGRKAKLVDRFKDKKIVWTPCGARRWEIEVVEE